MSDPPPPPPSASNNNSLKASASNESYFVTEIPARNIVHSAATEYSNNMLNTICEESTFNVDLSMISRLSASTPLPPQRSILGEIQNLNPQTVVAEVHNQPIVETPKKNSLMQARRLSNEQEEPPTVVRKQPSIFVKQSDITAEHLSEYAQTFLQSSSETTATTTSTLDDQDSDASQASNKQKRKLRKRKGTEEEQSPKTRRSSSRPKRKARPVMGSLIEKSLGAKLRRSK